MQDIIRFIESNKEALTDYTWLELAIMFNIEAFDLDRAAQSESYSNEARAKRACDIWRRYKKQKENLSLNKEVHIDGVLKSQTYTVEKDQPEVNYDDFFIEKLTTNPNGNGQPWLKLVRKNLAFDTKHLEDLTEMLKKEIQPLEQRQDFMSTIVPRGLFIYGSDKHIGAITKNNSNYKNEYTKEEIKKRIINATLDIIYEEATKANITDLFIMDLGDALDGYEQKTTRGLQGSSSHTLPQQMSSREQHDFYVEVHKELFDAIYQNVNIENIYFLCAGNSNHGGAFEYGAMKNLETYLNVKYNYIQTFVSDTPLNHFFYGKHCIIFGHGKDDEDAKFGMPLTINEKVEGIIQDYIRINNLHNYYITVVTGDLHQSAKTYGKAGNIRYKKVMSQYGSSKHSHTNYGSGAAGIDYDIITKHTRTISETTVFFEDTNKSNTGVKLR